MQPTRHFELTFTTSGDSVPRQVQGILVGRDLWSNKVKSNNRDQIASKLARVQSSQAIAMCTQMFDQCPFQLYVQDFKIQTANTPIGLLKELLKALADKLLELHGICNPTINRPPTPLPKGGLYHEPLALVAERKAWTLFLQQCNPEAEMDQMDQTSQNMITKP